MTRAVRTARGAAGALAATLFAAVSHAAAGGVVTPLAVVATAVLALPLCVALAGRAGSLWRLGLAVGASQFLYHWSFAGLGTASAQSAAGAAGAASPHAAHLAFAPLVPGLATGDAASAAAEAWMWIAHAAAAALTVALLHRGERAALGLVALVRRALPALPSLRRPAAVLRRPAILAAAAPRTLHERLTVLSAISHRGPPAAAASH